MSENKSSCPRVDIGGQAVMEGVMMKVPDAIAIAVRRSNGDIVVKRKEYVSPAKKHKWMGYPFIRGIINMGTMLSMGMSTLEESTKMLGTMDEEPTKFEKWLAAKLGKGVDKVVMGVAIVLAVILSVGLFFVIPEAVATALRATGMGRVGVNLLSGLVRILILVGYMLFCSTVPDVRRTFQYHGAEHKTVYCHEADKPLTPENAAPFTTLHPRCGTSFLLIVFVLSILLFTVAGYNGTVYIWRLLSRLVLLPIVAGVSYEVLKGLAHKDNKLTRALRWPGMQMQRLTTKEPDAKMLEIAIVAMNVALHGMPEHAETDEEGCAILKDYRESEPGWEPEAQA
ncbi:MAG: DUF1385 domain-containing protein [Clostridia bacterium]|nr:DUF1385 domain-containing protein [Clostridia bacterium]